MSKIFAIAWKDLTLRFSDRAELLFFIILPVIFTFLLGKSGLGSGDSRILLLVVDNDRSAMSASLIDTLNHSGTIYPQVMSEEQARKSYNDQNAVAWLTIPAGFESRLLSGGEAQLDLRKTPNNTSADAAQQAVQAAVSSTNRSLAVARNSVTEAERVRPFAGPADRQAYFTKSLESAQTVFQSAPQRVVTTQPATVKKDTFNMASQATNGQIITWVFIPLLATCGIFAFERRQKTLARLFTTPTGKATYLLGVITGQLAIALVQMALLLGFGVFILKNSLGSSIPGLALVMLSFGLAAVAMGTMLGTFIKTEKQASNLSIMLGMVMALLGGCWWPGELFPKAISTAARILPTTWAMQGFNDLTMRGLGLSQALPSVGILLAFAAAFFIVGVWRFRYE